jgi:CHAT domain-containing protein
VPAGADTKAFVAELLVASDHELASLVREGARRPDLGDWMPELLAADPEQGFLGLSVVLSGFEPRQAFEFWRLGWEAVSSPAAVPFVEKGLEAAERLLAADDSDEQAGWFVARATHELARVANEGGASDEAATMLIGARDLLERCGLAEPAFAALAGLVQMSLASGDVELIAASCDEFIRLAKDHVLNDPLREVIVSCASVAYYQLGSPALTLRCTELLNGNLRVRELAGFALLQLGRWDDALRFWDQIAAAKPSPSATLNRVIALEGLGHEVRDDLDSLAREHPEYWKGRLRRALYLLRHQDPDAIEDLKVGVESAAREDDDEVRLLQLVSEVAALATTRELKLSVADTLALLDEDRRAAVRMVGLRTQGELLGDAGRHAEASSRLRQALAQAESPHEPDATATRVRLVDELIEAGLDEDALTEVRLLLRKQSDPEAGAEQLRRLARRIAIADLTFLEASADAATMRFAPAEEQLTAILADDEMNTAALRLRGIVRLSTAARTDEDAWNKGATRERYLGGIVDLEAAAMRGDRDAEELYRWAVDRARGDFDMRGFLRWGGSNQYALIDGLAEADALHDRATEADAARDWPSAYELIVEAQAAYTAAGLRCEAVRKSLMLADVSLRASEPRRALDHLDAAEDLFTIGPEPPEADEAELAHELIEKSARRSQPSVAFSLDFLFFSMACIQSSTEYLTLISAQALSALGRHADALQQLGDERELIERRRRLGLLRLDDGESARSVIGVLRDAGEFQRAIDLRDLALEAAVGPVREAAIRTTFATCFQRMGDADRAAAELAEARKSAIPAANPAVDAVIDFNEASFLQSVDPQRSLALLNEKTIENLRVPARQGTALCIKASALLDLEELEEADRFAVDAERLLAEHMDSIALPSDRPVNQRAWINARTLRCEIAARRDLSDRALRLQAGLKAQALMAQQLESQDQSGDASAIEEAVIAERDALASLIRRAESQPDAVSWVHFRRLGEVGDDLLEGTEVGTPRIDLEKAKAARQSAQSRLERLQIEQRRIPAAIEPDDLGDLSSLTKVLASAPSPTTLIDFLLTERACYLTGLAADGEPWTVAIDCRREELSNLARQIQNSPDWSDSGPVWRSAELRRIIDAIQKKTLPGEHLVLIRHGPLHSLPLQGVEGTDGRLCDRNTVSYAPSWPAALSCRQREAADGADGLVLADSRSDLPHARLEGWAVADLLETIPIIGPRADRARVLAAIGTSSPKVIHIACHGTFNADDPDASLLMLAGGSANEEDPAVSNLTAREVAQLPLGGSIVVLSACHSGVTVTAGEESFGLTRAFLVAGARAVVSARWEVNDLSTWLLFRRFTELCRNDGLPIAAALAHAQRWLRGVSTEDLVEICTEALADARESGVRVEELLNRRRAEGLMLIGEEERALAAFRNADLLATAANRGAGESIAPLATIRHPFADRRHWAAFEVVGDWAATYPAKGTGR